MNKELTNWVTRDNEINENIINNVVDYLDEATMFHYNGTIDEQNQNTDVTNFHKERLSTNYFESLIKVLDYFLNGEDLKVDEEVLKNIDSCLEKLEKEIDQHSINTEEIRKALLLLNIKGFKSLNFSLDIITPDAIGLIFTSIIDSYFQDKEQLLMLDPNFGIGNLVYTIKNHSKILIHMIGMENHPLLANIAMRSANMMMEQLDMYFQDALEYSINEVDLIVSDLAVYEYDNSEYHSYLYDKGVKYYPYLQIEHDLLSEEPHLGIYLINNDFFSQENNDLFKQFLKDKAQILALITLPLSMFQDDQNGKSILVLNNKEQKNDNMNIFMLPDINKKEQFLNKMNEIKEFFKGAK